jgi:hypothetical protein
MPLPEISEPERKIELIPVWFLLDERTRERLIKWQRRHYHTELNPPFSKADIIDFDPAKEMKQKPSSEEHMKG